MRRILLVVSAAALVAAITAFSSVSAFAQEDEVCGPLVAPQPGSMGHWTKTCYRDEVVTENGPAEATEAPCQVGNSPRQGTQEGTVTTTYDVTYRTTYTYYYREGGSVLANDVSPNPLPEGDPVEQSREPVSENFEPTGPCKPDHPGGRPA